MKTLEQIEKAALLERLIAMRFRAESAADSLGIGRTTFYRKLKAWGLVAPMRCSIADRRGVLAEWKLRVLHELNQIPCDCGCAGCGFSCAHNCSVSQIFTMFDINSAGGPTQENDV